MESRLSTSGKDYLLVASTMNSAKEKILAINHSRIFPIGCLVGAVLVKITDPMAPVLIDGEIEDFCGAEYCPEESYFYNDTVLIPTVLDSTSTMMLSAWLGLSVLALGISCGLLDSRMKEPQTVSERSSTEHWLRAIKSAFQDPRLQLATPLALFIGLEQGFMFADFTEVSTFLYPDFMTYVRL